MIELETKRSIAAPLSLKGDKNGKLRVDVSQAVLREVNDILS